VFNIVRHEAEVNIEMNVFFRKYTWCILRDELFTYDDHELHTEAKVATNVLFGR